MEHLGDAWQQPLCDAPNLLICERSEPYTFTVTTLQYTASVYTYCAMHVLPCYLLYRVQPNKFCTGEGRRRQWELNGNTFPPTANPISFLNSILTKISDAFVKILTSLLEGIWREAPHHWENTFSTLMKNNKTQYPLFKRLVETRCWCFFLFINKALYPEQTCLLSSRRDNSWWEFSQIPLLNSPIDCDATPSL